MKYRNKTTGAVIDVPVAISGGDWEPVKKQQRKAERNERSERNGGERKERIRDR